MPKTYYNVTINAILGAGPNGGGFIDNRRVETYMVSGSSPATLAQSITKERANIRYERIIGKLGLMANLYISNVVASGANSITAPTSLSFRVESEHGDAPLVTADELNEGELLTGADAIKRSIARVFIENHHEMGDYYDPTPIAAIVPSGANVSAPRVGNRLERITAGALANSIQNAEAVITVTSV